MSEFRVRDRVRIAEDRRRPGKFMILGLEPKRARGADLAVPCALVQRLREGLGEINQVFWIEESALEHAEDAVSRLGRLA